MDLIELPPPGDGSYRPPTGGDGSRHRAIGWTAALIIVLLVVSVAVLNQHRAGQAASRNQVPSGDSDASPTAPAPSGSGQGGSGQGGSGSPGAGSTARVACPQIRDTQSHLGYLCIDNDLRQDGSDVYLGLRIALNLEVEPGWVLSEGSGDPTSVVLPDITTVGYRANHGGGGGGSAASATDVRNEVQRRAALALQQAYGDNPSARTLAGRVRELAGVPGYELSTEITINPAYRLSHGLRVKTERLWVVGLPSPSGVSIFMLTIPDDRSDLWPKAEAVVGTVHLI